MLTPFEELFSEKEREVINNCVSAEMFDSVPSALESAGMGSFEMTPDKERALEGYLNSKRPITEGESAVRNELQQKELEGYRIETPEQEREWQAKLDQENLAKRALLLGEEPKEEVKEEPVVVDDMDEIEMTRVEMMAELEKRGVAFKPTAKKAELMALLEPVHA